MSKTTMTRCLSASSRSPRTIKAAGIRQLIQTLLDDAFAQDKRVRLNVLQVNTRAYQLYRRLGFTEVIREGVTHEIRIRMQAQPPRLPEAGPTDR